MKFPELTFEKSFDVVYSEEDKIEKEILKRLDSSTVLYKSKFITYDVMVYMSELFITDMVYKIMYAYFNLGDDLPTPFSIVEEDFYNNLDNIDINISDEHRYQVDYNKIEVIVNVSVNGKFRGGYRSDIGRNLSGSDCITFKEKNNFFNYVSRSQEQCEENEKFFNEAKELEIIEQRQELMDMMIKERTKPTTKRNNKL